MDEHYAKVNMEMMKDVDLSTLTEQEGAFSEYLRNKPMGAHKSQKREIRPT
jgi:hypothetical protein